MKRALLLAALCAVSACNRPVAAQTTQPAADYVWLEAEQRDRGNFPPKNPFDPANAEEASKLSGGKWVGVAGPRKQPLFLEFSVTIPADGDWQLYARKFWKHGPYRWHFDDQPWQSVSKDIALMDQVPLRPNVEVDWTHAGETTLKSGPHRLRVELLENDSPAAFDCFLITRSPFTPRGRMKPDESFDVHEPGWFAFQPEADRDDSPINLRSLNEANAGDGGFIEADSGRFIHSKTGQPVRFWGVNVPQDVMKLDEAQLGALADLLARRGVNLVRLHGPIFIADGTDQGKPNPAAIERVQRCVAAFKSRGIYTTISLYFPIWMKLDASTGWAGYHAKTQISSPFAILFWDERFQLWHRDWWRALMTGDNPHGPKLCDEPAVLSCEIMNEDSLFFWTFEPYKRIPAEEMLPLEKKFGEFLTAKYGSVDAALTKWHTEHINGDEPGEGRAGICHLWRMANQRDLRSQDTVAFIAKIESDFYANTKSYLNKDLGVKSLVSGSNWTTASSQYLEPVERYANLSADFIDRHGYFNGLSEGDGSGYSVRAGNRYSDRSLLRGDPEKPGTAGHSFYNPIQDIQFDSAPTMVSEIGWLEPNRFDGEAPPFCAAMASLQDLDAIVFFAATGPGWNQTLSKFATQSPTGLAQYPAAALIYRLALIDEGPVVAKVTINVNDLLNVSGWPIGTQSGVNPLANYTGRVQIEFSSDHPSGTEIPTPIEQFVTDGSIHSANNQVSWDTKDGVLSITSPRAQGVVGFLSKAGKADLGDVTIESPMEFGSILLVPLDGQPIATSKRMLLQVMSEQKPYGWTTSGDDVKKIESVGQPPMMVREFSGTVSLKRRDAATITIEPLKPNGAATSIKTTGATSIALKPDAIYYLLEAR